MISKNSISFQIWLAVSILGIQLFGNFGCVNKFWGKKLKGRNTTWKNRAFGGWVGLRVKLLHFVLETNMALSVDRAVRPRNELLLLIEHQKKAIERQEGIIDRQQQMIEQQKKEIERQQRTIDRQRQDMAAMQVENICLLGENTALKKRKREDGSNSTCSQWVRHLRTTCPCQVLDCRQIRRLFPVHMHRKELTQCFSYVQHQDSGLARGLAVVDQTNEEAIYITCGTLNIQGVKDKSCCAMFGTWTANGWTFWREPRKGEGRGVPTDPSKMGAIGLPTEECPVGRNFRINELFHLLIFMGDSLGV